MKNLFLISLLGLAIPAVAEDVKTVAPIKAEAKAAAKPDAKEITVGVKGMVCAFCAQGIEKSFKAQKEVEGVEVSLEKKYVKIKYKDGQKLANEKIKTLLKEAGYEAVLDQ